MKFPKPWFRKGRGWFVTLDGQQIKLGKVKFLALKRYQEMMAHPPKRNIAASWLSRYRAARQEPRTEEPDPPSREKSNFSDEDANREAEVGPDVAIAQDLAWIACWYGRP